MRPIHRLIAVVLVWVAQAFALMVLYSTMALSHVTTLTVIILSGLLTGGAVAATWLITRQRPE